eukprot:3156505-Prymnesium_polylepis.1
MRHDGAELSANARTILAFVQSLAQRHGSIDGWLAAYGDFDADAVGRLRARLMQPATASAVDVS